MENRVTSTGYGPSHGQGRLDDWSSMELNESTGIRRWNSSVIWGFKNWKTPSAILLTILPPPDTDVDAAENEEAYAELIQFLTIKVFRLSWQTRKTMAKRIGNLRQHYAGSSKPRIISLYTELIYLVKRADESGTDCVIRAAIAAAALNSANENVSDSLLIAMVIKGLSESFKPFVVMVTQSDKQQKFTEFKAALRSFEDTERARTVTSDDSAMKTEYFAGVYTV